MAAPTIPDLKNLSLDVIERLIFWLFAAYIVAKLASFVGFSYWFLFFTIIIVSWSIVIVIDGIKVNKSPKYRLPFGANFEKYITYVNISFKTFRLIPKAEPF